MEAIEAMAMMAMSRVLKARNTLQRALIVQDPATDWLLEHSYITIGTTNAAAQAGVDGRWSHSSPYATKAGRAWYHAGPGAGVALLVVANAMSRNR